ncbi:MAG: NAD-dependent protein deacylase [Clostridiales bacterium]|nr:NAD-dependent protein deacylase [Clostridiales bacterium]
MISDENSLQDMVHFAQKIVFFGGAGVSTASGIPDFRSAFGLYRSIKGTTYEAMLSIDYFHSNQDDFWTFYKDILLYPNAQPNPAHIALAKLEEMGKLRAILTQNIDGLHQAAGSKNVLELHGSVHHNSCLRCRKQYNLHYVLAQSTTPHCDSCGGVLRPDIILYGEPLDEQVLRKSISAVKSCDLMIVGGTSLMVHPAASLIDYLPKNAQLVLINRSSTPYDKKAQLLIHDDISVVLSNALTKVQAER